MTSHLPCFGMRLLPASVSSLASSLCTEDLPYCSPSLVSPRRFLGVLYAIIQAVNEGWSIVPLRDTTGHWQPCGWSQAFESGCPADFTLALLASYPNLLDLAASILWETMSIDVLKAKIHNIHCCSFVHWAYHLLIGDREAAKVWFILNKSMCAVHRHLLSLYVPPAGFLCSLSRELMLIYLCWYFFLKEGDVSLFPASRNLPQWAWICWRWWESGLTLVSSLGILPGFMELHPVGLSAFHVSSLYCDKFLLLQILSVGLGQWKLWGWAQRWKAHWISQNFPWPLSLDLQFQAYFVCGNGLYHRYFTSCKCLY